MDQVYAEYVKKNWDKEWYSQETNIYKEETPHINVILYW